MNQQINYFVLGFFVLALLSVTACQKDDDDMTEPENEEEVITTVQLEFTPEGGGTALTYVFSDPDGVGGNAPAVDEIVLAANTTYEVAVEFIDRSNPSDPEFITEEVQDEAEEHLVCYAASGVLPAPVAKDQDANGDPLGLIAALVTTDAGSGTLTISLKHEPDKDATDACSTGETDVEAAFNVTIN